MTLTPTPRPSLPPEGRRIAFIGKGGAGKSTLLAYLLAHWADKDIPAAGMDTDKPGDEEMGSLYAWASQADLGAPVYPAPAHTRIGQETKRLTPAGGVLALDTGAWERKAGGVHYSVLGAVDLAVLALQPTDMELERAGSVLAALDHLRSVGAYAPRLVIVLTMVRTSAASHGETRKTLTDAGYHVLRTMVPRSDAKDGYAQAFGKPVRLVPGSPMDLLSDEILIEVAA